jgi:hypothetical protein
MRSARVLFVEVFMHMSDFQKMERNIITANGKMIKCSRYASRKRSYLCLLIRI